MADEVGDGDRVGDVAGEGAIAAVGDRPLGAADGRRAVAAARRELAVALAWRSWITLLLTLAAFASPALWRFLQIASLGAPLNAPSTIITVVRPLLARAWPGESG